MEATASQRNKACKHGALRKLTQALWVLKMDSFFFLLSCFSIWMICYILVGVMRITIQSVYMAQAVFNIENQYLAANSLIFFPQQVEASIEYVCRHEGQGAILVFLTGWDEISKLLEKLRENAYLRDANKFLILPLHGSMPTINQREIFQRPPSGVRYYLQHWS